MARMRPTKAQPPPDPLRAAIERAEQGEGFEESLGVLFVGCFPHLYERLVRTTGFDPVTGDPVAR